MSLIHYQQRYRPYALVNRLHSDLDRLTGLGADNEPAAVTDWLPAVDIREQDQRFVVHADLPGVPADDIEISKVQPRRIDVQVS